MASQANRKVAETVAEAFGGRPKVTANHDKDHTTTVHVATRVDSPTPGISSHSTLGLSDSPLMFEGREFDTRVELLTACHSDTEYFPDLLTTVAFCIIKGEWFCAPGSVFTDIVNLFDPNTALPHIYFCAPFLWGTEKFRTMDLPEKMVSFLQIIPISESERKYIVKHGDDALETLFEQEEVDVCDTYREPVA